MDESQLREQLQELGLTEYESKAYLAAVKLGNATPNDLVDESGVPQARIYGVIDDLQQQGFIEVQEQTSGKEVQAPSPKVVMQQFNERRIESFNKQINSIVPSLDQLHNHETTSEGFVTMVSIEESAIRHIRQAIEASEWWLTMSLPIHIYNQLQSEVVAAVERGVTVRLIIDGQKAKDADPRSGRIGPDFPDGIEVRHRLQADTFAFADRCYGIFNSQHPEGNSQPYIITQEKNLTLLLQNYAEQVWTGSEIIIANGDLPKRYLDPWRAIVNNNEDLDGDTTLIASVSGRETHSRRPGSWSGEVVDYEIRSPGDVGDFQAVSPSTASLTIATDDGKLTVGGWKATAEDIAADGLELDIK